MISMARSRASLAAESDYGIKFRKLWDPNWDPKLSEIGRISATLEESNRPPNALTHHNLDDLTSTLRICCYRTFNP